MADQDGPCLNEVSPSELVGRDTIARYRAQFQAAAYACLSILEGKAIDRVYCDFHDDFVIRHLADGKPVYHFYQVKTKAKKNYQWNKLDIFGLLKKQKSPATRIADSFAGQLLLHTTRFNASCGSVVFLTNIHVDEEVDETSSALAVGDFTNENAKQIAEAFNEAFVKGEPLDSDQVRSRLARLQFSTGATYLDPHSSEFDALAREAIYKYSEVDLGNLECKEIIGNLVSLVERKSFRKAIGSMSESELDDVAGIGVADLLDILSISRGAYRALQSGGDANAIRNASIIQRKLLQAGASEEMIAFCSKCKVEWDMWLRDKRHVLPEFELNFLLERLNGVKGQLAVGKIAFADQRILIDDLWNEEIVQRLSSTLTKELLLGGVLSALVRSESQ